MKQLLLACLLLCLFSFAAEASRGHGGRGDEGGGDNMGRNGGEVGNGGRAGPRPTCRLDPALCGGTKALKK